MSPCQISSSENGDAARPLALGTFSMRAFWTMETISLSVCALGLPILRCGWYPCWNHLDSLMRSTVSRLVGSGCSIPLQGKGTE